MVPLIFHLKLIIVRAHQLQLQSNSKLIAFNLKFVITIVNAIDLENHRECQGRPSRLNIYNYWNSYTRK